MKKKPPLDLRKKSLRGARVLIAAAVLAPGCGVGHPVGVVTGTRVTGVQPMVVACSDAQLSTASVVKCCDAPQALNQAQCTSIQRQDLADGADRCCPSAAPLPMVTGVAVQGEAQCSQEQLANGQLLHCCFTPAANSLQQSQCTDDEKTQTTTGFQRCCPPE